MTKFILAALMTLSAGAAMASQGPAGGSGIPGYDSNSPQQTCGDVADDGVTGAGGGGPGGGIFERGADGCAQRAPDYWDTHRKNYGPCEGGMGRHGWWSPSWGAMPKSACYSRDAAGATYVASTHAKALHACSSHTRAGHCYSLGCQQN